MVHHARERSGSVDLIMNVAMGASMPLNAVSRMILFCKHCYSILQSILSQKLAVGSSGLRAALKQFAGLAVFWIGRKLYGYLYLNEKLI